MKPGFLGDSYDIVKQSLLRWLGSMGAWATHPMFTESVTPQQAKALSHLLGTRLLSEETLTRASDREDYLAPARGCSEHVFLDPDTGIRLTPTGGKRAPLYVFGTELVAIAGARPEALTLVFDQSLARGREREQLEGKLSALAVHGLHGVAYVSHACFVLVGKNRPLVKRAFEVLKKESRLPESRFVKSGPQNNQMQRTRAASGEALTNAPETMPDIANEASGNNEKQIVALKDPKGKRHPTEPPEISRDDILRFLETPRRVPEAAEFFGISQKEARELLERAVESGLAIKPKKRPAIYQCVDAYQKSRGFFL